MTLLHPLIAEIVNDDRKHDPWGAGMAALSPVCDVLYVQGEGRRIPASAGYSPALMGNITATDLVEDESSGENYHQWTLLRALDPHGYPGVFVDDMPALTLDDLEYAAKLIDRYLDLVKAAGKDY